jgi:hypothetical protein
MAESLVGLALGNDGLMDLVRRLIAAPAALLLRARSISQEEIEVSTRPFAPPQDVIPVETNQVEVGVVVRDPQGHSVRGRRKEAFELRDDGKPQTIAEGAHHAWRLAVRRLVSGLGAWCQARRGTPFQ